MVKYIDADLLRKEIEFAKSVYDNPKRVVHGVADAFMQDGRAAMCEDILKKIDSLQQEQPEQPDESLEEAAHLFSESPEPLYSPGHRFHWDDDALFGKQIEASFIAGAKWQKEQMMKEAVDADVKLTLHDKTGDISLHTGYLPKELGIKCDDKVRIIIVKEEKNGQSD